MNGGIDKDTLYGENGDDTLIGSDGNDLLYGGNHTINIGGSQGTTNAYIGKGDTADYSSANSNQGIKVDMSVTQSDSNSNTYAVQEDGFGGKDYLDGIENIVGTDYTDTIIGDSNKNYIFGGAQVDTLEGGAGDDTLESGAGNDIIKATSYNDGNDLIDGEKNGVTDSGVDTVDYSAITSSTYHLEVNLSSAAVAGIASGEIS